MLLKGWGLTTAGRKSLQAELDQYRALQYLLHRDRFDADLAEEMRLHLDLRAPAP